MTRPRQTVPQTRLARAADGRLDRVIARLVAGPPEQRRARAAALTISPDLGAALADATVRLLRVDLDRAESLADALSWLAPRLGRQFVGKASRLRGHVAYQRGHYGVALRRYAAAARTLDVPGLEVERASVLMAAVNALSHMGRYDDALARAREARRIFLAHGDRLRAARLDANLAMVLFRRDQPDASLRLGQRALAVFEQLGAVEDVAITRLNTAARLTALHAFPRALRLYERTRRYCARHGLELLGLETDGNLAYLRAQQGEYAGALALYGRVRARAAAMGHEALATALLLDEAELLVELNADGRAVPLAEDALTRSRLHGMRYEGAKAQMLLAICAARQRRDDDALRSFDGARAAFEIEGNRSRVALTDLHRAVVLSQSGVLADAAAAAREARTALVAHGLAAKATLADLVLARGALAAGQPAEAAAHLADAARRLRRHPTPALAYQAAFLRGELARRAGHPAAATAAYRRAHRLLEGLWSHLGVEELRIAFLEDKTVVYEAMAQAALAAGPRRAAVARAFAFVEQAKSRALADLLAAGGHPLQEVSGAARRLRHDLNACYREIDRLEGGIERPPPKRLDLWRARARQCEQQLSRELYEAARRDPETAQLQGRGVVPLGEVQAVLGDACLIEYASLRGVLVAFVVDRRQARVVELGPADGLRDPVRLTLFNLTGLPPAFRPPARTRQLEPSTEVHLRQLCAQLIDPLGAAVEPGRPLVIAAHGPLHRVPFAALVTAQGYLGERSAIALTPSGSVYALACRRGRGRGRGALVLGLADSRAPRIAEEARQVAARLPASTLRLGPRATERALRQEGAGRRVVHLATHGFFRAEHPMFSSIQLANTRLDVQSCYGLRLVADLVTLSGCSTGVSYVSGGDELVGLSRGLLHAGAACVQLSLWDVDDDSTTVYMSAFYEHYARGLPPAEASRLAAADTRRLYPHPYHWAPFVTVGHGH